MTYHTSPLEEKKNKTLLTRIGKKNDKKKNEIDTEHTKKMAVWYSRLRFQMDLKRWKLNAREKTFLFR